MDTDAAAYAAHKIGLGTNQVMGFPREGEVGYTAATGIISTPAVATGRKHLLICKMLLHSRLRGRE